MGLGLMLAAAGSELAWGRMTCNTAWVRMYIGQRVR